MMPIWKGQLTKSDIGTPRDFRHVGGFNLAERIRHLTQASNTQQQARAQSQVQPESSPADADPIYEEIDEDAAATPPSTPTPDAVVSPPLPTQRRLLPVLSSPPPPLMPKPKRLSEQPYPPDVPPRPAPAQSDNITADMQSNRDSLTSFLNFAMMRATVEETSEENTSTDAQTQIVDLSYSLNSDESIYDDVPIATKPVEVLDNDRSHENSMEIIPAEPLLEDIEVDALRGTKRHPVGRSPSTAAALSMLDSVISFYEGIDEEDEDEDVEFAATDEKEEVKKTSDDSVPVQQMTPPVPKPRTIVSIISSRTTEEFSTHSVLNVYDDSKESIYDDVTDMSCVEKRCEDRDSVYDDVEVRSADEGARPPGLNGFQVECSAAEDTASCADDAESGSSMTWEKDACLSMDDIADPALRLLLHKAGVTNKELQDQATRDFIFQFILEHGGQEAVQKESHLLAKFKTVAVRKKKRRTRVMEINVDDDDVMGTYL